MLWLAAYLTGFPPAGLYTLSWTHGLAPGIPQCVVFENQFSTSGLVNVGKHWLNDLKDLRHMK